MDEKNGWAMYGTRQKAGVWVKELPEVKAKNLTEESTVEEACAAFIKSAAIRAMQEAGSRRAAEPYYALAVHFKEVTLKEFSTRRFAATWREEQYGRLAGGTINGIRSKCKKLCAWLSELEITNANGWANIERAPRHKTEKSRKIFALTQEEQEKLVNWLESYETRNGAEKGEYAEVVRLALSTAMRLGEILAIDGEDIDLTEKVVKVKEENAKTRRAREVPLTDEAVEILRKRKKAGRIFKATYVGVKKAVEGYSKKNPGERKVYMHLLRHTAITEAAEVLESVEELKAFSGHSSIQCLGGYLHTKRETLTRAREKLNKRKE